MEAHKIIIKVSPNRSLYPFIVAWCRYMKSFDYYIDMQCDQAAELKLPHGVIYVNPDGSYGQFKDIKSTTLKDHIERLADEA